MILTVLILAALVLFYMAGGIPLKDGIHIEIFQTIPFIFLMLCLCVSILNCCRKKKFSAGLAGFFLTHLAVISILTGALLGFKLGMKSEFSAPLMVQHSITSVPLRDGSKTELGFGLSASDFDVRFYKNTHTPEHFSVKLHFKEDERQETRMLMVNHPVTYSGWRFYLVSYDRTGRNFVVLSARNDPGRRLVVGGIWLLMVGIALICWKKKPQRAQKIDRTSKQKVTKEMKEENSALSAPLRDT